MPFHYLLDAERALFLHFRHINTSGCLRFDAIRRYCIDRQPPFTLLSDADIFAAPMRLLMPPYLSLRR